jgi:retron-type reverse transcriptase
LGNLETPPKVQKIQRVLYDKAKSAPGFRFYSLYDKVCDPEVLRYAYRKAKLNGGAPGIDGQTFEMIDQNGNAAWLDDLARELRERTYRPGAVRRILMPKPNGKMRPLGIPNIRDRVAQVAAVLVFEPDLPDESNTPAGMEGAPWTP